MSMIFHLWDSWPWPQVVFVLSLHAATFGLVLLHCLLHRRDPTSALFWILLSWFVPLIGPLLYLSFGIYKVPAKGRLKQQADQRFQATRRVLEESSMELAYWRAVRESQAREPQEPEALALNRAMDSSLEDFPLLGGNQLDLLISGDEAYPRMLEAIRSARHHVHLQTFILKDDETGRAFLNALADKARSGVTVRVMYDRFGSTHAVLRRLFSRYRHVPNLHLAGWTQANIFKRQFQVNLRNHRKILVIDGETAFTGGLNISHDNHSGNPETAIRDYHFAVRGPIVQELQFSFLQDWHFITGETSDKLLHQQHFPAATSDGKALVRVVNSGPDTEKETISDVFFLALTAARQQILAVTPYFAPTPDILHALRAAAARGVDVRLIVPQLNNHPYAGLAGQALYDELLSSGVRIFERMPPFMHAKALVVDDLLCLVGSANLDVRSLRLNYETDLAVYDDAFLATLKHAIHEELLFSHELTLAEWRSRPLSRRLLENFCSLFTPIL